MRGLQLENFHVSPLERAPTPRTQLTQQLLEPCGVGGGVANGVLNVAVPEIDLNQAAHREATQAFGKLVPSSPEPALCCASSWNF